MSAPASQRSAPGSAKSSASATASARASAAAASPPGSASAADKPASAAAAAEKKGGASKKKSKDGAAAPVKKVPKIKKSVLAEQERLVAEAGAAAAAEAARIEAEQRKAAEAAARKEDEARRNAESESERLHAQLERDREGLAARAADLSLLEEQVYERTSWDKYLECNPLPDVTQESSLNTYLSMWRDDSDDANTPLARYKPVIDSCSTTERVVDLLEEVNAEAREELQLRKHAWCQAFVHLLRNLTTSKIDLLTAQFLARYDEFENHETRVMNVAHNTPDIAFGLWVHNTAKRADGASVRVKRIEFPSIGFNMELPAALQKSRTSIRVVRTLFDHTSVAALGANNPNSLTAKMRRATLAAQGQMHVQSVHVQEGINSALVEPPEMPPHEKVLAEISRQAGELYAASLAAQAEQSSLTAASLGAHAPPVNFVSVGGIISIEQLALPPPPKKAKGWVMRDITALSKSIQIVPYPAASDDASAANQSPAAAAAQAGGAAGALAGGTSQAPMRVSFMLPAYVFLDDREPHFGWWDARHGCWRQEGVSLTKYEPRAEGGLVHLSLTLLKPVAIIQPRALDFPYRAWHLKPVHSTSSLAEAAGAEAGVAGGSGGVGVDLPLAQRLQLAHVYELQLQGSRFSVELEIGADHARLTNPISPVLSELNSQQMLPGILLNRMARAGINVQPAIEDAAYCRKPLKSLLLTAALHEHLALVAGVFEISGSPFNSSRSQRKCLVRVRLAQDSLLLAAAAEKRAALDEAARIAAEEARKREAAAGGGAKDAPVANSKDADMAAMIAAMEADPAADAAAAAARAAQEARAAEALKLAEADAPTPEQLAAAEAKRRALADEWFTVLVELATVEPPPPPKPKVSVQLFSQDRTKSASASISGTPATSRPATAAAEKLAAEEQVAAAVASEAFAAAAAAAEASPAPGTISEDIPGGRELLKFTLVQGADVEGNCSEQPLPDCVSHFSLRRCLLAYFMHLTDRDLATALDMQLDSRPPLPKSLRFLPEKKEQQPSGSPSASPQASPRTIAPAATDAAPGTAGGAPGTADPAAAAAAAAAAALAPTAEESLPHPSFLQADLPTLQIQQTIRRILNLTGVFTFH